MNQKEMDKLLSFRRQEELSDIDFLRSFDLKTKGLEKLSSCLGKDDLDGAKREIVHYFKVRKKGKWFFDLRDGRKGVIGRQCPFLWKPEFSNVLKEAEALLENRFILGSKIVLDFGRKLKWVTEESCDLGVPGNMFRRGDFFNTLAIAHARTRKAIYADKFAELIERWVVDWPFEIHDSFYKPFDPKLPHSQYGFKPLPTGCRLFNWMNCLYSGILFAPQVPVEAAYQLLKVMFFTGLQFRRWEKTPHGSGNVHIKNSGTTPALVALMFPECPLLRPLLKTTKKCFTRHISEDFLSDGGYQERSTSYLKATMEMFLGPLLLAKLNNVTILRSADLKKLKGSCEQFSHLMFPQGVPPNVGDGHPNREVVASFLGLAAKAFESQTIAQRIRQLRLEKFLPLDLKPKVELNASLLKQVCYYPVSGYFVARTGQGCRSSAVAMTIPDGENRFSNHAHEDALSLEMVVGGVPIIGTPATTLYHEANSAKNRDKPLRGYTYSMESHNVVLVGSNPVSPLASFIDSWGVDPIPVKSEWNEIGEGVCLKASHEGYNGVKLTREMDFNFRKGWTVRDHIEGKAKAPHVLRWHFEYGVEVKKEGESFVATRGGRGLKLSFSGKVIHQKKLYRNDKWMGNTLSSAGRATPWVIDVYFGEGSGDWVTTDLKIMRSN
jgi:hypothetical protein